MITIVRFFLVFVSMGLLTSGISANNKNSLSERVNIDIPPADLSYDQMNFAAVGLSQFFTDGESFVSIEDIANAIGITRSDSPFATIIRSALETRNETVKLMCTGRRCEIESSGTSAKIKLEGISIPGLGEAELNVGSTVSLAIFIPEDLQKIDVCQISGLAVRSGFLRQNVDGLLLAANGTAMAKMFIDIGFGGDYPSASCR